MCLCPRGAGAERGQHHKDFQHAAPLEHHRHGVEGLCQGWGSPWENGSISKKKPKRLRLQKAKKERSLQKAKKERCLWCCSAQGLAPCPPPHLESFTQPLPSFQASVMPASPPSPRSHSQSAADSCSRLFHARFQAGGGLRMTRCGDPKVGGIQRHEERRKTEMMLGGSCKLGTRSTRDTFSSREHCRADTSGLVGLVWLQGPRDMHPQGPHLVGSAGDLAFQLR